MKVVVGAPRLIVGALLLVCVAEGVLPSLAVRRPTTDVARHAPLSMGRAEKRAAAKRAKKGGGTAAAQRPAARRDVMTQDAIKLKLREVPVFGILADVTEDGSPSYLQAEDGLSSFFLDHREAELVACRRRWIPPSGPAAKEGRSP